MRGKRTRILGIGLLCFCMMFGLPVQAKAEMRTEPQVTVTSIALDVSGSMRERDEEQMALSLISLMIDICGENDYLCVTAYNDDIVYSSGLCDMGEESIKEQMKEAVQNLEYAGDTDNGLGLSIATAAITDSGVAYDRANVLLISDGNTDLEESSRGRTVEDSNRDLAESAATAAEQGIVINAIEYTDEVSEDTNMLSVQTAATGGGITMVDEKNQFVQVMLSTFFSEYCDARVRFTEDKSEELLRRKTFEPEENARNYVVIIAENPIEDFEILEGPEQVKKKLGESYALLVTEQADTELSVICSFKESTAVVCAVAAAPLPKEEPVIATEIEESEMIVAEEPVAEEPVEKENPLPVVLIILLIVLLTAAVCVVIIKKLLGQKEEPAVFISGKLTLQFIDMKSKHEAEKVVWDLREYPPAGVSLKELFDGKQIKEDLKDLDKICFYPNGQEEKLILVHCMEGGVFAGDNLIPANKPYKLQPGSVLYISFAENASEIELRYDRADS